MRYLGFSPRFAETSIAFSAPLLIQAVILPAETPNSERASFTVNVRGASARIAGLPTLFALATVPSFTLGQLQELTQDPRFFHRGGQTAANFRWLWDKFGN
jgi:hypothetical protein